MILEWINTNYGISLNEEEINPIKEFTLLWNIFENRLFDSKFTLQKLEDLVKTEKLIFEEFDPYYNYFYKRYFLEEIGDIHVLFPDQKSDRDNVIDILEKEESPEGDKLYALAVIAYRFRNNLFHGNKTIEDLPKQVENFGNINQVLRCFLEQLDE